jgi:hypothetical protein
MESKPHQLSAFSRQLSALSRQRFNRQSLNHSIAICSLTHGAVGAREPFQI